MKNCLLIFLIATIHSQFDLYGSELYEDKEGNFKIDFYTEPVKEARPVFYTFGSYTATVLSVNEPDDMNESYSLLYFDIPSKVIHSDSISALNNFFANTQKDYYQSLGESSLNHVFFIKANGYPGREFSWSDHSSQTTSTRRVYLIENRLYVLEVIYKFNNQHNIKIAKFLNSFSLLDSRLNENMETEPELPEKKFSVTFPGITLTRDLFSYGKFGVQALKAEMYQANSGKSSDQDHNLAYGVLYGVINKDTSSNLTEEERHTYIKQMIHETQVVKTGGKVINEAEIQFKNNWCLKSKVLVPGRNYVIETRAFFKDNYIYLLVVMSEPEFEGNAASSKFFESFKFN